MRAEVNPTPTPAEAHISLFYNPQSKCWDAWGNI